MQTFNIENGVHIYSGHAFLNVYTCKPLQCIVIKCILSRISINSIFTSVIVKLTMQVLVKHQKDAN